MRLASAAFAAAILASSAAAHAQYVMAADFDDRVQLFDALNGLAVAPDFIPDDLTGLIYNLQSPKEAIQIGNEIWVTDQLSDAVFRFTASLTPTFLEAIDTGLDNIRGIALINGEVLVCNDGFGTTSNPAPGPALVRFSTNGTPLGVIPLPAGVSPWDVVPFGDNLLVSNSDNDDLEIYDFTGTLVSVFHASDGATSIDFPQQIQVLANGNIMVAGFSAPAGIYIFSPDGGLSDFQPVPFGVRGIFELENGRILYTEGSVSGGVRSWNPADDALQYLAPGTNVQYLTRLTLAPPCGSADFDGDGDTGTDADIEAFFACLGGNCCPTCGTADFDQDGDTGTDADIEAFFRVLGGGTC
jgi:hypothetical protein